MIFTFVWNGKIETIKRSTLLLNRQLGGTGLFHLKNKLKSFRLSHVNFYMVIILNIKRYSLGDFNQIFTLFHIIPHSLLRPSVYEQLNTLLKTVKTNIPDFEWECAKKYTFIEL